MFDQRCRRVISELYPEDAMADRSYERLFAKFREGDRSLQDLRRTVRPQTLDRQYLKAAVDAYSSVTSRELAIVFGSYQQTLINVLHDIGKVCKRGRWNPLKLNKNHKIHIIVTCQSMLAMAKKGTFSTQF